MNDKNKINGLRSILNNMIEARAEELNVKSKHPEFFKMKDLDTEEHESSFNEKVEKYIKSRKNK